MATPRTAAAGLTDEQEQPVARGAASRCCSSAAAGSGKTSVLVERFVRAVREDGIAPARILAITFTERAAGELRERVRARLLALGEREAARDAEAAFGRHLPRLLRAAAARPPAARPGSTRRSRSSTRASPARLRERAFAAALGGFLDGRARAGRRPRRRLRRRTRARA